LNLKFEKSIEALSTSYDTYMKTIAPAPEFLPIRIKILFAQRP